MDSELLAQFLVFTIAMCFSPGPNNILCAAHGSQHGFKGPLPLISGMAVGWSSLGIFVGGATVFIEKNQNFFDLLMDNKLNIVEKIKFPDHHKYSEQELGNLLNKNLDNLIYLFSYRAFLVL